jgi:uncharacterized protein YjbJ (UPF0337 family)
LVLRIVGNSLPAYRSRARTREVTVGDMKDKAKNAAQETKGRVEEATGKLTDDERLEAEGKKDKMAGSLKQAGEKVKDAFE